MTRLEHLHILELQKVLLQNEKYEELLEITTKLINEAETKGGN